jgi:hypothetical protein
VDISLLRERNRGERCTEHHYDVRCAGVAAPQWSNLQPCLRRISRDNFADNRILAIRSVLSWAT